MVLTPILSTTSGLSSSVRARRLRSAFIDRKLDDWIDNLEDDDIDYFYNLMVNGQIDDIMDVFRYDYDAEYDDYDEYHDHDRYSDDYEDDGDYDEYYGGYYALESDEYYDQYDDDYYEMQDKTNGISQSKSNKGHGGIAANSFRSNSQLGSIKKIDAPPPKTVNERMAEDAIICEKEFGEFCEVNLNCCGIPRVIGNNEPIFVNGQCHAGKCRFELDCESNKGKSVFLVFSRILDHSQHFPAFQGTFSISKHLERFPAFQKFFRHFKAILPFLTFLQSCSQNKHLKRFFRIPN